MNEEEVVHFEPLKWFCVLPYDLIKLLITNNYLDPRTRLSFIQTCHRLFSTFYQYNFQRRWLSIGLEPPPVFLLPENYKQCATCKACMYTESFKKHECRTIPTEKQYCMWCMMAYTEEQRHTYETCARRNNLRCRLCGTWHIGSSGVYNFACPFSREKCRNRDRSVKEHTHLRIQFIKCEVCKQNGYCISDICPLVLPPCGQHAIRECKWCGDLLDPAVLNVKDHTCVLIEHKWSRYLNQTVNKLSDTVYLTEKRYNGDHYMFVTTPFDIPNMLTLNNTRVNTVDHEFLVHF